MHKTIPLFGVRGHNIGDCSKLTHR